MPPSLFKTMPDGVMDRDEMQRVSACDKGDALEWRPDGLALGIDARTTERRVFRLRFAEDSAGKALKCALVVLLESRPAAASHNALSTCFTCSSALAAPR